MKLSTKGKIIVLLFDIAIYISGELCLIQVVFRRDEPIWTLYLFICICLTFLYCAVHDAIENHIKWKKQLHESSYERR